MENKHINGKNLDADMGHKGTTVVENPKGKSAVKDKPESSRSKESESTSCDKDKPIDSNRSETNEIIKQEPIQSDESGVNSDLMKSDGVTTKEEPPDDQEVIDLTKKIFSSLPIKSESIDTVQKSKNEGLTVNKMYMYVSEDRKVYHAAPTECGKQYSSEKDKNSVVSQDGVEYEIRPVKDDQLCELVFEYLKLKKTDAKGVFTISLDSSNRETMEEENVIIKEEPKEIEEHKSKNDEEKNEDEPLRRKQPTRGAKMNKVVSYDEQVEDEDWDVKTSCTQTPAPQPDSKISKQAALKKLYSTAPMVPLPKMDNQDYLTLVLEKSARSSRKRKGGLIIDNKTDIPILEMKMNMQVTADTLCQTPQMAPTSKKQMESLEKDSILVSPGKKLQSEKLIKLYNSRLISSSVPDSDDELEDLGLEKGIKPPDWMKKRSGGNMEANVEPSEKNYIPNLEDSKKWKKCYI